MFHLMEPREGEDFFLFQELELDSDLDELDLFPLSGRGQLLHISKAEMEIAHKAQNVVFQQEIDVAESLNGCSPTRKKALKMIRDDPNTYYYRFNAPEQDQSFGPWNFQEEQLFYERMKTCPIMHDNWGVFSQFIPGRAGYQCANFYRFLIRQGKLQSDQYQFDWTGRLVFVGDVVTAARLIPRERVFKMKQDQISEEKRKTEEMEQKKLEDREHNYKTSYKPEIGKSARTSPVERRQESEARPDYGRKKLSLAKSTLCDTTISVRAVKALKTEFSGAEMSIIDEFKSANSHQFQLANFKWIGAGEATEKQIHNYRRKIRNGSKRRH